MILWIPNPYPTPPHPPPLSDEVQVWSHEQCGQSTHVHGASSRTGGVALFSTFLWGFPAQFELVTFAQIGDLKSRLVLCNVTALLGMQCNAFLILLSAMTCMWRHCRTWWVHSALCCYIQIVLFFILMKRYGMFADKACFVSDTPHQAQTINEM